MSNEYSAITVSYSKAGLFRLTSLVGLVHASFRSTAVLAALYVIMFDVVRLITIGIFTAIFSLNLGAVMTARLIDIFAANAV